MGQSLAFIAGIGLPGLACLVGHLVDASNRKTNGSLFNKKVYPTIGAMEAIAIVTTLCSVFAWSTLN